jgi:hypothetical protein
VLPFDQVLTHRRPVWEALSTMFLDTDVSTSRDWRANALAASPYSVAELEQILIHEVYPVCQPNLRSVAGEWSGFDSEWLHQAIVSRPAHGMRAWFNLGRFTIPRDDEWCETKRLIEKARAGRGQKGHSGVSQDNS